MKFKPETPITSILNKINRLYKPIAPELIKEIRPLYLWFKYAETHLILLNDNDYKKDINIELKIMLKAFNKKQHWHDSSSAISHIALSCKNYSTLGMYLQTKVQRKNEYILYLIISRLNHFFNDLHKLWSPEERLQRALNPHIFKENFDNKCMILLSELVKDLKGIDNGD